MAELMEKIPTEKCWAITTKSLWRLIMRGGGRFAPQLGIGEGAIALTMGKEKYDEINQKLWGDYGRKFLPIFKEISHIPVEDTIEAARLYIFAWILLMGPKLMFKITETTPEKVIVKITKCICWETYNESKVNPAFRNCDLSHQAFMEEGFKVVNPQISFMITKTRSKEDPYCEFVITFKEV